MTTVFEIGMAHEMTFETRPEHTARYFYEKLPDVLATPFLAGFMERVSAECMAQRLAPEEQSVGVSMTLRHMAATPLGMPVRVRTELTAVDGAKLTFRLQAWDAAEQIGDATHERFVISCEKFNARVAKKRSATP